LAPVPAALRQKLFPEAVELIVDSKKVLLRREGQPDTQFQDLSDGYRSMLSLSIDLLRWLTKAFPHQPNLMDCPGVVLIDELDTHLHPKWQREIGFWLREKFPNIQFIVGTHSPFLAQVADEGPKDTPHQTGSSNVKLMETAHGVTAFPAEENARLLSPEQILQGELFDMKSMLSPPIEMKLEQLDSLKRLRSQGTLRPGDAERMLLLQQELDLLPSAATPQGREVEKALGAAVQRAAHKLNALQ